MHSFLIKKVRKVFTSHYRISIKKLHTSTLKKQLNFNERKKLNYTIFLYQLKCYFIIEYLKYIQLKQKILRKDYEGKKWCEESIYANPQTGIQMKNSVLNPKSINVIIIHVFIFPIYTNKRKNWVCLYRSINV